MPEKIKDHIRKRTVKDLYFISIIVIVSFIFFSFIDLFEWLYQTSRSIEMLEIDEIIPTFIVLSICSIIFSLRRWKESIYLSLYCEELSLTDPLTNLPNRRVIEKLLADLPNSSEYPVSLILVDIQGLQYIKEQLGLSLAEHSLIQYLNLITQNLNENQLIAQWHSEQFIIYCPHYNHEKTNHLIERLNQVHQNIENTILASINVTYTFENVFSDKQVADVLSQLEDNLHKSHSEKNK
ncbi:diguanylate cyclase domain-containing protein [Pseudoalteromonas denitrificans]|uniref:Diguanylate cyclase (GGDEF) domain-containing protein n=1 Tax=Pseudoalteromonas denitrificans DSM 6059 TaxID=1123010 RepID=A0A1I1FBF5_9GAMM|nr:diguanylate cyclase [Pseudoalteromonas denitrificans]SFB96611.1 diguanylate cyclase (GGDEF) domain-containing protein [Pseudoalteromonas denitrificans DSM 6059]